jgi:bleomycin hydrolase
MGSAPSKPAPAVTPVDHEKFSSTSALVNQRTAELANLTLNDRGADLRAELDTSLFAKWDDHLLADPKNRLALSAFTQGDMLQIIRRRDAVINGGLHLFSDKIEAEGKPVTNQRSSGRCWLFASTNVMRVSLMKKSARSSPFLTALGTNSRNSSIRNNTSSSGTNLRKRIVRFVIED